MSSGLHAQEPQHDADGASTTETLPSPTPAPGTEPQKDPSSNFAVVGGTKDFGFLPIPKSLQYDPQHPAHFGLAMNVTFGLASTFSAYMICYAIGLLFITPLGDLVRRRQLLLLLAATTASLTIGLAITKNLVVFEVLSFLIGVGSVTPQILMPLAADLAPPERRASALSIVLSGLLFGVLIARVLAGVVAQFVTWRVVYFIAIGVQYGVLVMLYFMLPDYPAKNKGITYFGILYSMAKFTVTEPLLVQAILITIPSSACFTNWWVTLTFLLGGPQYNYSTIVIGLFGLVGMVGVATAPFVGRTIDGLVPWSATLVAICMLTLTFTLQTAAVGLNVAVVVIVCIGLDVFRQTQQVSITTAVLGLEPNARSRLNAVVLLSLFIGQVMGTAVGSKVYTDHGWRPDASLNLAWTVFSLIVLLARGPHVPRYTWLGWAGGWELRKSRVVARQQAEASKDVEAGGGGAAVEAEAEDDKGALDEKRRSADEAEERGRERSAEKRGDEAV
ncbi:hypothetical protein TRAPUB_11488 [Trametes pubescens]|uniref:Major facilitator superfamily (MFS) profile domain-containing protein n=1 Tax=Trametes pubescens TaxID=154538 RepID=A0A1M2VWP4_TRAPU|nr:hypothetical protein TRAPUB_11488 [Trametes pubescens]